MDAEQREMYDALYLGAVLVLALVFTIFFIFALVLAIVRS